MNPEGLELLRDIHAPADPSIWPPAIGWWFVVIMVVLFLIYRPQLTRYARARSRRREALRDLDALRKRAGSDSDAAVAADLSELMRRVALRKFPEENCAGVAGQAWLEFLRRTDKSDAMHSPLALRLLDAPYRRRPQIETAELVDLGASWIEQHA